MGKGSGSSCARPALVSDAEVMPDDIISEHKKFQVLTRRATIREHPNADAIEICEIDAYQSIVRKGEIQTGDLVLYIPEASVVPKAILQAMNLWDDETDKGRLAGSKGNRVKPVRLRSVLSQGLVYVPDQNTAPFEVQAAFAGNREGIDVTQALGITKWRPPIPTDLAGKVEVAYAIRPYTDIENIKRWPNVFETGEEVVCSEKAHGTSTICTFADGELYVSSKGFAGKKMALVNEPGPDGKAKNAYWRMAERFAVRDKLAALSAENGGQSVTLYGETLGVQDLNYGLPKGELDFKAFDLRVGEDFVDTDRCNAALERLEIPQVPLLYRGPFSLEKMDEVASGREQITGQEAHIREGTVIRPAHERKHPELGRVILKHISDAYYDKKNRGKNATEFE